MYSTFKNDLSLFQPKNNQINSLMNRVVFSAKKTGMGRLSWLNLACCLFVYSKHYSCNSHGILWCHILRCTPVILHQNVVKTMAGKVYYG